MTQPTRFQQLPVKVAAWGVAYLAAGWVVIEVTSVVGPQFGVPAWVQRSVTILVGFGFLATLALAWQTDGDRRLGWLGGLSLVIIALAAISVVAATALRTVDGPETELRVINVQPEAGSVLERESLAAGVPVRVVVEHAVQEWTTEEMDLRVSLMTQIAPPNGRASDGSWRLITDQPARSERSQVAVEGTLTSQSVLEDQIILRVALATRAEGSLMIGPQASVLIYYGVDSRQ